MFLFCVFISLFFALVGGKVGPESQVGFFCTNLSKSDKYGCDRVTEKLRLFIVGDIGGKEHNGNHSPTDGQQSVAKLMGQLAKKGLNLVLNLGDNFYENGVTEEDVEERFKTNFLKVFGTVGSETVPWYTIAGNRDYKADGANISPQIEKTTGKWTFPAPYYVIHYNFGTKARRVAVRFVMIDTVILCGQNRKVFRNLKESPVEKVEASEKHFEWLIKQLHLAEKGVDFLFVAGHYPLYLTDGDRSFSCAKRLQKLFLDHRVSAYFSGHEHNLKYLSIKGDVPRIVSGAGSRMESAIYENHVPKEFGEQLWFGYPDSIEVKQNGKIVEDKYLGGGFVAMEIDEETMEADIKFYAAGYIYPTKETFSSNSPNEFEYTVKLQKRSNKVAKDF